MPGFFETLRFIPNGELGTEFGKNDARISQGAIVSNKLLSGALEYIKQQQAIKDAEKLCGLHTRRDRTPLLRRTADLR